MKYLKLKSLTWWSSVALGGVQIARMAGIEIPKEVDTAIIALAGIGLRGALKD